MSTSVQALSALPRANRCKTTQCAAQPSGCSFKTHCASSMMPATWLLWALDHDLRWLLLWGLAVHHCGHTPVRAWH